MSLGGILHQSARHGGKGLDDWGTPKPFFDIWSKRVGGFSLDACASSQNRKVSEYYGFDNGANGLLRPWKTWTWCNPPYSERTDTVAFHRYCSQATLIVFLQGRMRFLDPATQQPSKHPAPTGSMIVVFKAGELGRCRYVLEPIKGGSGDFVI